MFKDLLKLFKPFKKAQRFLTLIGLLQYTCLACVTFSIKLIVDYLNEGQYDTLIRVILVSLFFLILALLFSIIDHYLWNKMITESIAYLRGLVIKGIIKKRPQYFIENTQGSLLSKIMNDVVIVAQSGSIGKPMLQINVFRIIVVIAVLTYLNPLLAFAIIVFIPAYFLLFNLINKGLRGTSERERERFSDIQTNVQETLSAIETIKVYKKEDYFQAQINRTMKRYLSQYKLLNQFRSIGFGLSGIFSIILPIVILFIGAVMVFRNQMSLGTLISFYAFLPFLTEPVNNLSDYYLGGQTTLGMVGRIMEYLEEDEEVHGDVKIDVISTIKFSDVSFRYFEN
jgi:ABC-type bacteriocin/lantibiotic exporter with double-glycine peptidase domain